MSVPIEWRSVLASIEGSRSPLGELEVLRDLQRAAKQLRERGSEIDKELEAEIVAFALREEPAAEKSEWGIAFGPILSTTADDGRVSEWPGRNAILPDTIAYWKKRAGECPHPALRRRYGRLAWELARVVPGMTPDYRMAWIAVDSAIDIARRGLARSEVECIRSLRTALYIAHQINDTGRIEAVRDEMIWYEDQVAVDEKAGLWGFCFDCLVMDGLGHPSSDQIARIVRLLEDRLVRLTAPTKESIDPWKVEAVVQRLARYYRRSGSAEDSTRVLRALAAAFDAAADNAGPMLASALLEHSHSVMNAYGLTEEADRIAVRLRDLGPAVRDSLKKVSVEGTIPTDKIREAIDDILNSDWKEALKRVAANFVPLRDRTEKQVRDLASRYPLGFLFPVSIKDYMGRTVSSVGSLDEDADGRLIHQMSQDLQFMGFLLRATLAEAARRGILTVDRVLEYLYESPAFRSEFREVIGHGMQKYLEGDATSAIHILTPQVEAATRTLLEKAGVRVLKPIRDGAGFDIRALDDLLRDRATQDMLGEDLGTYLRVVFSDRRGWNIRNRVCHALLPSAEIGMGIADRVVHTVLCLGLVEEKTRPSAADLGNMDG